jgi:S-adenosylmethionine hydrolase
VSVISIMTDFGLKDGNVGVMKGVIWGICPEARIADLSHTITPQNVVEASLILARSAPFFPEGTVNLVVVDPGVGTERRAMAARVGKSYFVGPDNGIITLWLEQSRATGASAQFVTLDRPEYWLAEISHVFHGRDIFAPVAAHLARGVPLAEVGTGFDNPILLALPVPSRSQNVWTGEVIHVDHFGNIASNIRLEHIDADLPKAPNMIVQVGPTRIDGLVQTFGERPAGSLVALVGSTGNLIVSVVNGSAAERLAIKVGDTIRLELPQ